LRRAIEVDNSSPAQSVMWKVVWRSLRNNQEKLAFRSLIDDLTILFKDYE